MEEHGRNNLLAQAGLHQAMFSWLEDDRQVPGTSLTQSLQEWKVVLAMYASALERRPITLEGFEPHNDLVERYREEAGNSA